MSAAPKTLIVILGPTASGKTDVAIQLSRHFRTEIISADSRQFYKEIPIGTAAPEKEQLSETIHHFVGHLSVEDEYNVSKFEQDVLTMLDSKFSSLNKMIMVGGSGLYINAVCKGIDDLPDPDEKLRKQLNELYDSRGLPALQNKLKELDPLYFEEVDRNNPKRLLRAIEVCMQTGKPYSEQRMNKSKKRDFNIIKIGLELPRVVLNDRINQRTRIMLEKGWEAEARSVYQLKHLNALNTVGYKELFRYFDDEWSFDTAIEKIQTNTRRYAKRQMTWFKKDKEVNWFKPDEVSEMIDFLEDQLTE